MTHMINMELKIYNPEKMNYYTLAYFPRENIYFLQKDDGKGMGFSQQKLFDMFDSYFKENF